MVVEPTLLFLQGNFLGRVKVSTSVYLNLFQAPFSIGTNWRPKISTKISILLNVPKRSFDSVSGFSTQDLVNQVTEDPVQERNYIRPYMSSVSYRSHWLRTLDFIGRYIISDVIIHLVVPRRRRQVSGDRWRVEVVPPLPVHFSVTLPVDQRVKPRGSFLGHICRKNTCQYSYYYECIFLKRE